MRKSDLKLSRLQADDKRPREIGTLTSLPPHLRQHPTLTGAPLPRNHRPDERTMSMKIGVILAAEFVGVHQSIILALHPHLLFQSPHKTLNARVKLFHLTT